MAAEDTISKDTLPVEMTEEEIALLAAERVEEERKATARRQEQLDMLAAQIEKKFHERARRRKTKEQQWVECTNLYLGPLGEVGIAQGETPFSERRRSSKPYHNIVGNKCDIAIAQSVDYQFAGGEKNWSLGPEVNVKDPSLAERARLMEAEIEAQLEHCSYGRKSRRAIEDRVILGSGIVKGPVNTGKPYIAYEHDPAADIWIPRPMYENTPNIEWVNPWYFYPDDTVNDFNQCGDALQVHPSSAKDLRALRSHPGFIAEAIDEALAHAPKAYASTAFSDYTQITSSNPYLFENKYVLIEYHGPLSDDMLEALSIEPSYDAEGRDYYGEVWVVCGKVVRLELENIEASFEIPYALSTWKKDPSSVFGFGSPLLMQDAQRVAREVWRMILDNGSLSSGVQVAYHAQFVEPVNGEWQLQPNKAWRLLDSSVNVENALKFFDVPNITAQLMPILNLARQFGEEESMTPMVAGGLQGADTVDTASGALMMRENSTTVLDFLSEDWDDNVTEKVIRRMYGWNMQYGTRPEIKGNYSVDVRTITEYKSAQMNLRDLERLSMEASQNPAIGMLINLDQLSRARLAAMRIPYTGIVKSPEEVAQAQQEAANQPNPEMMKLQMQQMELQLREKELQIEEAKLAMEGQRMQFEVSQQQQREMWDHEEKMSANYARTIEAEARVISTQNEKEIQLLQLAAKMEDAKERNRITQQIAVENNATKRFDAQMKANSKARDQLLVQEEQLLKRETGSGI